MISQALVLAPNSAGPNFPTYNAFPVAERTHRRRVPGNYEAATPEEDAEKRRLSARISEAIGYALRTSPGYETIIP